MSCKYFFRECVETGFKAGCRFLKNRHLIEYFYPSEAKRMKKTKRYSSAEAREKIAGRIDASAGDSSLCDAESLQSVVRIFMQYMYALRIAAG